MSDGPKIMEKFSQPADENGHVFLPGRGGGERSPILSKSYKKKKTVKKFEKAAKLKKNQKKSEKSDIFFFTENGLNEL